MLSGLASAGLATVSLISTPGLNTIAMGNEADLNDSYSNTELQIVYPPPGHETSAEQIFLIGTAPSEGEVRVNGEVIDRSPAGHFAPSFPLVMGDNSFILEYGDQQLERTVTRLSTQPPVPEGTSFVSESLVPTVDIARLPGERICFGAIAPPDAEVSVTIGTQTLSLMPQPSSVNLPPNFAVLTRQNAPLETTATDAVTYEGCSSFATPGALGQPLYRLSLGGEEVSEAAGGTLNILSPDDLQIAEVTSHSGAARTGPSTSYSRLTPLPMGTQATVTGRDGNWYRLDYGVWIRDTDVAVRPGAVPPRSLIRSIQSRQRDGWTDVLFPLQVPVPVSTEQGDDTFALTLHNTTAQTDTIFVDADPIIRRLDWMQPNPDHARYTFHLTTDQQWGYTLRYEDTTLVLSLRHPPTLAPEPRPLEGISILLDPGHGGEELGARGPTGYPEKDVNLVVSRRLRDELMERGATVYLTREEDIAVSLGDRMEQIRQLAPTLALSIHYNALPDNGDAINTAGIGMFWYHPQAHDLSVFLHDYLTQTLDRPSYGVFWNNLALTRPSTAPSVLLELGFMINPTEFEWIIDPDEQQRLAGAIADGIVQWFQTQ
jgi:N-acetylmuramoyl-L-alanine amidase